MQSIHAPSTPPHRALFLGIIISNFSIRQDPSAARYVSLGSKFQKPAGRSKGIVFRENRPTTRGTGLYYEPRDFDAKNGTPQRALQKTSKYVRE